MGANEGQKSMDKGLQPPSSCAGTRWQCFLDWIKRRGKKAFSFMFGKVSDVHLQDARERYWILWREVETALYSTASELELPMGDPPGNTSEVESYVKNRRNEADGLLKKMRASEAGTGDDDPKRKIKKEKIEQFKRLLNYYKILLKDRELVTRREKHLSALWRDMTFIRIRLLTDRIIKADMMAMHMGFCREEARRLKVQDNPEIKELLHEAAMELDESDAGGNKNIRAIRTISTILTRLNDLRIQWMHEQLRNKNTFQWALICLLPLSLILLSAHKLVLYPKNFTPMVALKSSSPTFDWFASSSWWSTPFLLLESLSGLVINLMVDNPLFFIFFAGLIGGFFSAVMRLQISDGLPGEGAYFRWYILTKPFVGALGATILYIIVHANLIQFDLLDAEGFLAAITKNPIGAKGFTFGFLTGFSERIIMPTLKVQ